MGHDLGGRAVSGWWKCICFVCLFCLLLSRRLARAQADSKDEQGGKSAIKHVKVLLAGGVDAGTQGRELRRCNSEFADRFVS